MVKCGVAVDRMNIRSEHSIDINWDSGVRFRHGKEVLHKTWISFPGVERIWVSFKRLQDDPGLQNDPG